LAQGLGVSRNLRDPAAIEATFKSGVQECIHKYGFDINQPIAVTAFDDWYKETAEKWVARNKELRVNQYLTIAMDQTSAELARYNGFPALNAHGECVGMNSSKLKSSDMISWELPDMFSSAKFLVPGLLMQEGFKRVLFSEMDVFFIENPFDATGTVQEGHLLAMRNEKAPNPTLANIGFMEFHPDEKGKLTAMILNFAHKMVEDEEYHTEGLGKDQIAFNEYIKDFSFFRMTLLDPPYFAVKGGERTNFTKVVHFAFALPECKMERLKQLYDNPKSPVADQPGIHTPDLEAWQEC